MVPFTPRLIPAILPNLAHHVPAMKSAAIETNSSLFALIQSLPAPVNASSPPPAMVPGMVPSTSLRAIPGSPPLPPVRQSSSKDIPSSVSSREDIPALLDGADKNTPTPTLKNRMLSTTTESTTSTTVNGVNGPYNNDSTSRDQSRSHSPTTSVTIPPAVTTYTQQQLQSPVSTEPPPQNREEVDPFDYPATVNALTVQFLSEHEETRVAALKWLLMLHQKAPKKVRVE